MGVQEPVEEAFVEVPATPPGVRDLDSDDDLYAKTNEEEKRPLPSYKNDFFKGDLPVIPYKGMFDFLGVQDEKVIWNLQTPTKKKKEPCPSCVEEVKRDLRKFEEFVEDYKNERDVLKAENESLKKEVEELKKILKRRDNDNVGVKVSISNKEEDRFDVLVRKRSSEKTSFNNSNYDSSNQSVLEPSNNYGIRSFSISLPKENVHQSSANADYIERDTKAKKSVAQLRKEFFEKSFQSEQKTFTSRNYLEIKPEENKTTFRSRINVRVNPKTRISEVISKLTNHSNSGSKLIPETTPVFLFQRFEKTKVVWENDLKKRFVTQRSY